MSSPLSPPPPPVSLVLCHMVEASCSQSLGWYPSLPFTGLLKIDYLPRTRVCAQDVTVTGQPWRTGGGVGQGAVLVSRRS